ncbi:3-phenylpropionate/trans-cinnamate dioxygenase ferredoxin reductase subunit [Variovorax boronicumulans]|uniref:NAD(P)/FAD-dependent oxidoreductase n=1 Tax=Variovorax boronicumulans TaxID=436515 RepID=UPI0027837F25|nr:FAD-dependent oxidoreductase [Variovorax boronicumulans]MDP9920506.1 3-phenylpropionate/trans-cinnamate dioxygenase ferredoxin reductase subunit [Variovorax boronicumulans]
MRENEILLIVGAGHAGAELAVAARQQGWLGRIDLIGDEAMLPYQRPPLSKAYLHGAASFESLALRPASAYEAARVQVHPGAHLVQIDRAGHRIHLQDGRVMPYTKLALCVGGRPRTLVLPGMDAGTKPRNLHYLRTLTDADAIRAGLKESARLVVVGGGYVGLELAASARKFGAEVTVIEALPRVLARVTGAQVAAFYEAVHREAGVQLRTGLSVERAELADDGAITTLVCASGERIAADIVVAGIGMLPNVELAQAAGLAIDGGIVVDAFSQTSDPDILAAGDCTAQHSALYNRHIRLESVPNALEQARAAASALCGKPKPNHAVPWFWSDQYDLKLQMVGLSQGHDACVLRGDPASRRFIAFYLKEGVVIAADAVNRPADFMLAKRLVAAGVVVDASVLGDDSVSLKDCLPASPAVSTTAAQLG